MAVNTTRLRYSSEGGLHCTKATDAKDGNLVGEWMLEAEGEEGGAANIEVTPGFSGPEAITEGAAHVGATRATLRGTVELEGIATHYAFFAYPAGGPCEGPTCYTSGVETISGEAPQEVTGTIKGLEPETSYEYVLAVLDVEGGFTEGEALQLTTEDRHATRFEAGVSMVTE